MTTLSKMPIFVSMELVSTQLTKEKKSSMKVFAAAYGNCPLLGNVSIQSLYGSSNVVLSRSVSRAVPLRECPIWELKLKTNVLYPFSALIYLKCPLLCYFHWWQDLQISRALCFNRIWQMLRDWPTRAKRLWLFWDTTGRVREQTELLFWWQRAKCTVLLLWKTRYKCLHAFFFVCVCPKKCLTWEWIACTLPFS